MTPEVRFIFTPSGIQRDGSDTLHGTGTGNGMGAIRKRGGILGGYSLHILQPQLEGGVFCVSSDLNSGKKVRIFHFRGRGGGVSVPSDNK